MPDIDDLIQEFERQWATGRPQLAEFLAAATLVTSREAAASRDDVTPQNPLLLAELIKVDLHHQWRRNASSSDEPQQVDDASKPTLYLEDYRQQFSQVDISDYILPVLEEELLARRHVNGDVTLEELTKRFPSQPAEALAAVLARVQAYVAGEKGGNAMRTQVESETFEDRFEIRGLLGQGGMGRVYLAYDPRLKRQVAVKVPIFDLRSDGVARQRFLREGQVAASLKHPNVVTIYETGEIDHQCFIVAEYVDGPTLGRWLVDQPKRLSPERIAEIVRLIARAVHAAHVKGILHRDLKPANVLLETTLAPVNADEGWIQLDDRAVRPRITDFGLASCADDMSALTTTGAVLGTAAYMAPEQATGELIGPQVDVFSIGLILYEMLFDARPFAGESIIRVVDRFRGTKPIQLPHDESIPTDLRLICDRCLQFDMSDRYKTAIDVADDLQRFVSGEPTHVRPVSWFARLRRFASLPDRIRQAALTAIVIESAILFSFLFVVVMKAAGMSTGIAADTPTVIFESAKMCAFPTIPIIVFGALSLRGRSWAFVANLCLSVLMVAFVAYNVVAPEPTISFYRGNRLATFLGHSIILGVAVGQLALHVIAIPAALRLRKLAQR